MLNHRIQYDEKLSHTSYDSHFFELTGIKQSLVELPDHGIESGSYKGSHIQSSPNRSSSSPDSSFTAQGSAITIKWCDTGKGNIERHFIATCGFKYYESWFKFSQKITDCSNAIWSIHELSGFVISLNCNIQSITGYIYSNICLHRVRLLSGPSLQNAGLVNPCNCSGSYYIWGETTMLSHGLIKPRANRSIPPVNINDTIFLRYKGERGCSSRQAGVTDEGQHCSVCTLLTCVNIGHIMPSILELSNRIQGK
jgi:hypothetical protein